tara:strand:+ start:95 stop:517 length:423 start_codon:yes stop_codon:yes gene_type:complete
MFKKIEREIQIFTEATGLVDRQEIIHGTLYVKLRDDKDCDFFHKELRTMYKETIAPDGGVNMYAVGDEFAFDFVPEDREAPVFSDKEYSGKEDMMPSDTDKGVWSEFAEEEMLNNLDEDDLIEAEAEIQMQLEAESKRGK